MVILIEKKNKNANSGKDFIVEEKENGCWESISHKAKDGFGYTQMNRNKKTTKAHRYFYEKFIGKIPEGLHVLHKCDNPKCCNPKHLFVGTNYDNVRDKINKGRQSSHVGSKNPKCILNEQDIINIFYDKRKQITIAREYGVSDSTIRDIKKFRSWTHITNRLRGVV